MTDYSQKVHIAEGPIPQGRVSGGIKAALPYVEAALEDGKARKIGPLDTAEGSAGEGGKMSEFNRAYRNFSSAVQKVRRDHTDDEGQCSVTASVTQETTNEGGFVYVKLARLAIPAQARRRRKVNEASD